MGKQSKSERIRHFSCVTYANEEQILNVFLPHQNKVRALAYILHDKDVDENGVIKEPHYHILFSKYDGSTLSAVKNWFYGITDENGVVNTLVQRCSSLSAQFDYLIHKHDIKKYQYDISEIKGYNHEFFKDVSVQDTDNLSLALQDVLDGVPLSVLVKKYGRDFIIHYHHIKQLVQDIYSTEKGVNVFDSSQDKEF